MRKILAAAVIMFLSLVAVKADAATGTIELVPAANGVFSVRGINFVDVAGIQIEIKYDTATLSNPSITSGPMLASTMNVNNPKFSSSSLMIAGMTLSPINGSGDIATIKFNLKGDTPGFVTVVNLKITGPQGTPGKSTVDDGKAAADKAAADKAAADKAAADKAAADKAAAEQNGNATANTTYGTPSIGTITLPQDQLASTDRKTDYQPLVTDLRKDMTLPLGGSAAAQTSADKQQEGKEKGQEKKFVSSKSTLQLFSEFTGERSPRSLIALFAESSIPGFTQDPPIAFADGKTPLRISLALKSTGSQAPKFILQGANVKQLSGEGEDLITWTVDAIPKKDATEAKLTVIDGQSIFEIPLTIVPRIDPLLTKEKALSEADFALYLKKPQKFDLNKDEKFDAVDDFIYTANYIVAMKIKPEKVTKEEPPKPDVKGADKPKEPAKLKDEKGKAGTKPAVKP